MTMADTGCKRRLLGECCTVTDVFQRGYLADDARLGVWIRCSFERNTSTTPWVMMNSRSPGRPFRQMIVPLVNCWSFRENGRDDGIPADSGVWNNWKCSAKASCMHDS